MDFSIKCDLGGIDRALQDMLAEDLPFTIARFLTMQALDAQLEVRGRASSIFKLRNDWTVRNIKITPATKKDLFSVVYTDTGNRRTGAPDYLPRQDEGGERVPLAGHRFLAIPTKYLWKYTPSNRPIPDKLRPSALLPAGAAMGQQYASAFSSGSRAEGHHRLVSKATLKKLGNGEYVAFVQATHSGTLCIFVRHGGMGYKTGSHEAEPWYTLVRSAHIPARFPMENIVAGVVDANAEKNFDRAAAEVLVSNAMRRGLSVQF